MKNSITIVFIFITTMAFSQNIDSVMFDYINQYRVKNHKSVLTWSEGLHQSSIKQAHKMVEKDSIYHTGGNEFTENCAYGKNFGITDITNYKNFIKKYFNIKYEDVTKDVNVYYATIVIYAWAMHGPHKEVMLYNSTQGSVHIIIKDVVKKNNILLGRELMKGYGPIYYKATVSVTFEGN